MFAYITFWYLFYERSTNDWIYLTKKFKKINGKTFKIKLRCKILIIENFDEFNVQYKDCLYFVGWKRFVEINYEYILRLRLEVS